MLQPTGMAISDGLVNREHHPSISFTTLTLVLKPVNSKTKDTSIPMISHVCFKLHSVLLDVRCTLAIVTSQCQANPLLQAPAAVANIVKVGRDNVEWVISPKLS